MNILIFGATGNIGKKLAKRLMEMGHFVSNVSRDINKSESLLPFINSHLSLDNNEELQRAIALSDVVINLAGFPVSEKWTVENKQLIYNSRINITRKIVELINSSQNKPKKFISSSAIGFYGNGREHLLTIDSPPGVGFLANVCLDWEEEAQKVDEAVLLIIPRIGIVLDKESGALPKMATPFKLFVGGILGDGRQWMSWIHFDDLVNLFIEFIETDNYEGILNAVSPNSVRNHTFSKILAKVLNRPNLLFVPSFVLKIILGESASMVLNSQKVFPEKLIQNDFEFKFPELERALINLLK